MTGQTFRYLTDEPAFSFGYGLTFTSFSYDNLQVARQEDVISIALSLENTGLSSSTDIVQVYFSLQASKTDRLLGCRNVPLWELKAFDRVFVNAGMTEQIDFKISVN